MSSRVVHEALLFIHLSMSFVHCRDDTCSLYGYLGSLINVSGNLMNSRSQSRIICSGIC